ncbi:MAG TPA: YidB family protein [Woeseiaceae bacterium]|nr:YidB family protein [Woeseiaceae bacterium]
MLDALLKNPEMLGDVAKFASENPQIAKAAMEMFSSTSGAGGGLGDLVSSLKSGGLGDAVSSWLGVGDNQAVDPAKLEKALGSDKISSFARQAGISGSEASTLLAGMLPGIIDKLSPDGKLPDAGGLDGMIGGLLGSLGGKR